MIGLFRDRGAPSFLRYPLDLTTFFLMAYRALFLESSRGSISTFSLVRRQIYFTAILGFPVIAVGALSVGALVFSNAISQLPGLGAGQEVGPITNSVLFREIVPLITALIVIARSGTAITTELGNMRIHREMDLLETHGVSVWYFVIFPRIQGMIVAMVMLVLYFDLIAFVGGYTIVYALFPEAVEYPFELFLNEIRLSHVLISLLKAVSFGVVIGTVSSFQGMQPRLSATEIPQSATKSVVHSLAFCILVNTFISIYL